MAEINRLVPEQSCLTTTSDLAVYFVNRNCLSWFDKSLDSAEYVLINENSAQGFDYDRNFIVKVYELEKQKSLSRIAQRGEISLFKKNQ